MEPTFGLGVDEAGKEKLVQTGYKFVLHRHDGKTFRRETPKKRKPKKNDWGAEPYKLQRERQDAGRKSRAA
jgi:hypothetical protein